MRVKNISKIYLIIAIILLILSLICVGEGFNKMMNYKNSDKYSEKSINAYVGGDAYNYIINACYFAGYVSLGGCLFVSSTIFAISSIKDEEENKKRRSHSM